ncbi:MAG: cell surface protein [Myxococcaceae bacterium]|nr:cell surface protein [Myxococcaceae bacterium]
MVAALCLSGLGSGRALPAQEVARHRRAAPFVSSFAAPAAGADGSTLRGPHRDAAVLWRVRTSRRVFSSPALTREGWATFGSLDGTVQAVDRGGVVRWSHRLASRVFSSPATVGELTVIGSDAREVVALDARGSLRWRAALPQDMDAPVFALADGGVLVASGDLRAFTREGELRWTTPLAGHVYGAVARGAGSEVLVPEMRGSVAVVDSADGRLVRRVELGSFLYGGALALDGGAFVVGLGDGTVRCFGPEGSPRWSFSTDGAARRLGVRATPALRADGVVVVGAEDGRIYGLRAADGSVAFRVVTSAPVRSRACVDRDGWAFVGGEDDQVHAIGPDNAEAWRVTLGADVDSGPRLVADGVLVVGADDGALHAIAGTP